MRYSEFIEKLNQHYHTDIFYKDYDCDMSDLDNAYINVRTGTNKSMSVDVEIETYNIKNFYISGYISYEELSLLTKFDKVSDVFKLEKELAKEQENTDYWRNKDRENNAVKEFAQDTILKAIEG